MLPTLRVSMAEVAEGQWSRIEGRGVEASRGTVVFTVRVRQGHETAHSGSETRFSSRGAEPSEEIVLEAVEC